MKKLLLTLTENLDRLAIPVIIVAALVLAYSVWGGKGLNQTPPDDAWFQTQVIERDEPIVVKFGAEWCGPCRQMDKMLGQYVASDNSMPVLFVDVDEQPQLAAHYGVRGIPQTFLFKQGKPVAQITGSRDLQAFRSWVADYQ